MHFSHTRLIVVAAATAAVFALTFAAKDSSIAQRTKGDEGTGGAAGYSPPIDMGQGAPAPMNAPAAPSTTSEDAGEQPPAADVTSPDEKKDDGTLPPDAPGAPDQPD